MTCWTPCRRSKPPDPPQQLIDAAERARTEESSMRTTYRNQAQAKSISGPPTAAELMAHFSYEPDTGLFKRFMKSGAAKECRSTMPNGYMRIGFQGKDYYQHRIAWLFVHGAWPSEHIDHINGNKSDNRIANLRDVSNRTNRENKRSAAANSRSGLLGARPHRKKWQAVIQVDRKTICLGTYPSPEMAHQVYVKAKRELHKGCTL